MATPETFADTLEFYHCSNYSMLLVFSEPITAGSYPYDAGSDTRFQMRIVGTEYVSVSGSITLGEIGEYGELISVRFQGSVEPSVGWIKTQGFSSETEDSKPCSMPAEAV